MPEISHQKLTAFLGDSKAIQSMSIYLLHGEEYLCKKALEKVLDILLPGKQRNHNCILMDGGSDAMATAISELNTFSFLSEGKVVVINDAKVFIGEDSKDILIGNIDAALGEDKMDKAARHFLAYLSHSGFTLDDLDLENSVKTTVLAPFSDQTSIQKLVQYCKRKKIKPAGNQGIDDFLQRSIEKGFPDNHHLILMEDIIDRRRKLFKSIKERGLVVDCSVPKGQRKADKDAQAVILKETLMSILSSHQKNIEPAAYKTLCEMTGFDLPVFCQDIEKLINYIGERTTIRKMDVMAVVERSRQDPIFEFTNAILERNAKEAVFFLDSLLRQEMHPLQALTAVIKQIRNLLIAKDFVLSSKGSVWRKGCSYGQFTSNVLPAIENYDKEMMALLNSWGEELADIKSEGLQKDKKRGKKRSNSAASDLRLAKNPKSPYPIYQLMLRSDNFSREKILASLEKLSQTDYLLKTTPRSPRLVLEESIFFICNA